MRFPQEEVNVWDYFPEKAARKRQHFAERRTGKPVCCRRHRTQMALYRAARAVGDRRRRGRSSAHRRQLVAGDSRMQEQLDEFVRSVPVGLTGQSLQTFADAYLDSLLTYGNALGEMLIDNRTGYLGGLQTVPAELVQIRPGSHPLERQYWLRGEQESDSIRIARPERILFTALNPPPGGVYGVSVLRGLPALSHILLRIYACIGQYYDRMGNVRYAVTYKPSNDPNERAYAGERARQIAKEWSEGMRAGAAGEIRDFICAGDVDIRVIGADNALLDTEVPVRQLLEQLIAKLSIPPFLLGLNWSSTERMSSQQADILTSELEYYRRLLDPVLRRVGTAFLRLAGSQADVSVEWSNINLQDETEYAQARLWNAQAAQIEAELEP
ncbi:MAG: serine/threonine protein phosphatase [Ruminococcus sp.]